MTESEFFDLQTGDRFRRDGKEFSVVKQQGKSQVAHPVGDPRLLVHWRPEQAPEMMKTEVTPDIIRPKSSHGFPLLERAKPKLPDHHMEADSERTICLSLDGGLSEYRLSGAIGPPLPGMTEFLAAAVESNLSILLCTDRSRSECYEWLRIHCPGAERIVQVSNHPPAAGAIYLSRVARSLGDTYPSIEQLLAHAESTPTPVEAVG